MNSAWLNHELGHIAQQHASANWDAYRLGYAGSLEMGAVFVLNQNASLASLHSLNPMEVDANRRAHLPADAGERFGAIPDLNVQDQYTSADGKFSWGFSVPDGA